SDIEAKDVAFTTVAPPAFSPFSTESVAGVHPDLASNIRSPPNSDRDWSRTDRTTLPANESMATRAATPNEMDDMYKSRRRRVVRDSRQASPTRGVPALIVPPAPSVTVSTR